MDATVQDLRSSLRVLLKTQGKTLVDGLTLALGIGVYQGAFRGHFSELFLYAVCVLFDYGVGENLPRDAVDLGLRHFGSEPIVQSQREILALPHGGDFAVSDLAQGVLDGLALGIQDRCLEGDVDMGLHNP